MAKLKPEQAAEKLQRISDMNAVSPKHVYGHPELYRVELKSAKLPISVITPKVVVLADAIDRLQGMAMQQRIRRINELGERNRRKRTGESMKANRRQLVALFTELGLKAAGKWKKAEMLRHVESLPDDIEELLDGRAIWDLENDKLCRQLVDAVTDGLEIEFINDKKQESRGDQMTENIKVKTTASATKLPKSVQEAIKKITAVKKKATTKVAKAAKKKATKKVTEKKNITVKKKAIKKSVTKAVKATAKKTTTVKKKATKKTTTNKMSVLDAAAEVLSESKKSLGCKEMIEQMESKGYWKSPGGNTPFATLWGGILREINIKGKDSRFKKTGPGLFGLK